MRLSVGCSFGYRGAGETAAVVLVEPHSELASTIEQAGWDEEPLERYQDLYGNVCRRLLLPAGASSFGYSAVVRVSAEPEAMPGLQDVQRRIEDLPAPLLHWLLPSRLCESDALSDRAWELFGRTPMGVERVQAICDWIHGAIAYGTASVPTTTAAETLDCAGGMCRDFAHLGITFSRALGIPARYVSGYIADIGVPGPFPPMDFHAWFEVWLGERWWTFDARYNVPRIGRVAVGRGRDAVDVAMVTTYGEASLEQMTVWADELVEEGAGFARSRSVHGGL